MRFAFVIAVFLAAAVCACENEAPKTALGYTENAKRAYDVAMEDFKAHNWVEAQNLFREVKRKYSYSKYARQAELRLADADVEQEKFADAIREYKDFVHAHRSDTEDCIYARSKMAEATFAQIPESFLMPASEERDQAPVIDAYKELKSFLADYPEAKSAPRMRELLGNITARLVRHELYVARFYLKRDNYDAAVARIQYALRTYGEADSATVSSADSSLKAEALVLLGTTFLKMNKWTDARQAFEAVVHGYAQSPLAAEANNYLDFLRKRGS
jgi:outer membrane protein assembly factor BamD